jgi:hypothetical protein
MLDKFCQQFVGLGSGEVEETDAQVFEVPPALDVLVVQVIVNAVVGLE